MDWNSKFAENESLEKNVLVVAVLEKGGENWFEIPKKVEVKCFLLSFFFSC